MSTSAGRANRAVIAARAPSGTLHPDDFAIEQVAMPAPGPGEVLFRAQWLAVTPSVRRRLPAAPDAPSPLGQVTGVGEPVLAGFPPARSGLDGALIGEVVESRDPRFAPGDLVRGGNSWQLYHCAPGDVLDRLEPVAGIGVEAELAQLGQPGLVADCGIELARVRPGETVLVSAAGGAIGMLAGQLAREAGARVVGVASGEKVGYVVRELGFDGCVDRGAGSIGAQLDTLVPDGIDVYFDNVGGSLLDDVFGRLNDFGRLIVCGMAAEYDGREPSAGPPLRPVLRKRLRIEGFVVSDHYDRYPAYRARAIEAMRAGRLRFRIQQRQGLAQAPLALADLLAGRSFGRILIDLRTEEG